MDTAGYFLKVALLQLYNSLVTVNDEVSGGTSYSFHHHADVCQVSTVDLAVQFCALSTRKLLMFYALRGVMCGGRPGTRSVCTFGFEKPSGCCILGWRRALNFSCHYIAV